LFIVKKVQISFHVILLLNNVQKHAMYKCMRREKINYLS